MKIWTCGSSPRSGSRNAWTRIKNVNGDNRLSNFWNFFGAIQNYFLSRLVNMDETWLYHYDPETKQQLMEWRHSGSHRPKTFRVQKTAEKVLASIFLDQDGILLIDYLPKGQAINAQYYSSLLVQLKDILKEKRPCRGKVSKGGLVLARQFPGSLGTCNPEETGLPGLPKSWSPTLFSGSGPVDYHLFPGPKKQLKGLHFSSDAEVIAAAETWLDGQHYDFFWVACKSQSNGLRSVLSKGLRSVLNFVGSMLNESRVLSL